MSELIAEFGNICSLIPPLQSVHEFGSLAESCRKEKEKKV